MAQSAGWGESDWSVQGRRRETLPRLSGRHTAGEALPTVVATGTGSGKTEAFLMPIIDHCLRVALTVAFVNPGRGSRPYHSKNSSSPRLYTRRVIGDETLSSTNRFSLCQWAACGTTIKSV